MTRRDAWKAGAVQVLSLRRDIRVTVPAVGADPRLSLAGRRADSLRFVVLQGMAPDGYPGTDPPGFRYDVVVALPLATPNLPTTSRPASPGGLDAFPFFVYFAPSARFEPPSLFAPALTVARHLRTHRCYEVGPSRYELACAPPRSNSTWLRCDDTNADEAGADGGRDSGCCHDLIAPTDQLARDRAVILRYLETLLEWGDAVTGRDAGASLQQARLIYGTASKLLGQRPLTVHQEAIAGTEPATVTDFVPAATPLNPRLLLSKQAADRLAPIHSCQSGYRRRDGQACFSLDAGPGARRRTRPRLPGSHSMTLRRAATKGDSSRSRRRSRHCHTCPNIRYGRGTLGPQVLTPDSRRRKAATARAVRAGLLL